MFCIILFLACFNFGNPVEKLREDLNHQFDALTELQMSYNIVNDKSDNEQTLSTIINSLCGSITNDLFIGLVNKDSNSLHKFNAEISNRIQFFEKNLEQIGYIGLIRLLEFEEQQNKDEFKSDELKKSNMKLLIEHIHPNLERVIKNLIQSLKKYEESL